MGRPPEVFVRPVTMTEGRRLRRIGRTASDPVRLRRAIVVLMSAQGQSAPDIAHLLDCSQEYVRTVIHAFNESGFAALDPKWSGGRPKMISEQADVDDHDAALPPGISPAAPPSPAPKPWAGFTSLWTPYARQHRQGPWPAAGGHDRWPFTTPGSPHEIAAPDRLSAGSCME
jgi:Winged helix-turn helix